VGRRVRRRWRRANTLGRGCVAALGALPSAHADAAEKRRVRGPSVVAVGLNEGRKPPKHRSRTAPSTRRANISAGSAPRKDGKGEKATTPRRGIVGLQGRLRPIAAHYSWEEELRQLARFGPGASGGNTLDLPNVSKLCHVPKLTVRALLDCNGDIVDFNQCCFCAALDARSGVDARIR